MQSRGGEPLLRSVGKTPSLKKKTREEELEFNCWKIRDNCCKGELSIALSDQDINWVTSCSFSFFLKVIIL